MAITLNFNLSSLQAGRQLEKNTTALNNSLQRLSSGYRINSSKDDAAGLQISNKLQSQIRGNQKAIENMQDGMNLLNMAEGTYTSVLGGIQRIRELTVQFANDTNGSDQASAIKTEIFALVAEMDRSFKAFDYNGKKLFQDFTGTGNQLQSSTVFNSENVSYLVPNAVDFSSFLGGVRIQTGANANTGDVINISTVFLDMSNFNTLIITDPNDLDSDPLEDDNFPMAYGTIHSPQQMARAYLQRLDSMQTFLSGQVAKVGTFQNRLQSNLDNLSVTNENLATANSRIRDVDVAKESANLTRYQILQQASASLLGQANQQPVQALQLIRGLS